MKKNIIIIGIGKRCQNDFLPALLASDSYNIVGIYARSNRTMLINGTTYSIKKLDELTNDALKNVSFNIKKGQTIGIIGSSGAGKSTIVDILLGLLEVKSGQILIDGTSIYENILSWQSRIGYVPQQIYLIDDSIMNKIAFGVPPENINLEFVKKAIELSQLNEIISSLDNSMF